MFHHRNKLKVKPDKYSTHFILFTLIGYLHPSFPDPHKTPDKKTNRNRARNHHKPDSVSISLVIVANSTDEGYYHGN